MATPEKSSAGGSKFSPSTTGLGPDATNAAVPVIKKAIVYYAPKFKKKELAYSFNSIEIPFIKKDKGNNVRSENDGTWRIKGEYNSDNTNSNGIFYINIDLPIVQDERLIQPWVSLRIKTIYLKVDDLDLKKYLFAEFKKIRNSIRANIDESDNSFDSFEGDDWEANSNSTEADLDELLKKITNALTQVNNAETRNTFAQKVNDIVKKLNNASVSEGAAASEGAGASKDPGESKETLPSKYVDLRF
tara:strand:- start:2085 stop:2822 length:738 start_codon:yes stop_codon:yes gene_type:complete